MIILTLAITETRPEEMRVIKNDNWFLVQTKNLKNIWITQKEHKDEKSAILDCVQWY